MKADTPIELASLTKMTDGEIDGLLLQIRERRLRPVREYEEMLALKEVAKQELYEKQFDQHIRMFEKELAQFDRVVAKLEARRIQLQSLRMMIGQ